MKGCRRASPMALRSGHLEAGDEAFGVVREANPVDAVGRFQLSRAYYRRLVVAGDHGAVDRALHLVALHGEGDLLGHRLARCRGLVHRGVRLAATAIHPKSFRTKTADDEAP